MQMIDEVLKELMPDFRAVIEKQVDDDAHDRIIFGGDFLGRYGVRWANIGYDIGEEHKDTVADQIAVWCQEADKAISQWIWAVRILNELADKIAECNTGEFRYNNGRLKKERLRKRVQEQIDELIGGFLERLYYGGK